MAIFNFDRDIHRFVAGGLRGQGRDPRVLELLGPDLLAAQARHETSSAGDWQAWSDVSRLWAEHARRTGSSVSLEAADRAAGEALACAGRAGLAWARLAAGRTALVRHDLFGDSEALSQAEAAAEAAISGRSAVDAHATLIHARALSRQAIQAGSLSEVRAACALLDAAIHDLSSLKRSESRWTETDLIEARLERAALTSAAGVRERDPRLLDQSGRELRAILGGAEAHMTPLTRMRALAATAAGLSVLAGAAGREDCLTQAADLLAAAEDLITADHSPTDAAAVRAARAAALLRLDALSPMPEALDMAARCASEAARLTGGRGLRLGCEINVLNSRLKVRRAEAGGDVVGLSTLEARARANLAHEAGHEDPVGWAVSQLTLAWTYEALDRLGSSPSRAASAGLAREAAREVLDEHGISWRQA